MERRSDHVSLIAIMFRYEQVSRSEAKSFCKQHALNERSMAKAIAIRTQLMEYMNQILQQRGTAAKQEKTENISELILKCMVEGLPLNMANRAESSGVLTYTTKTGQVVHIHPSSILHPSQKRQL